MRIKNTAEKYYLSYLIVNGIFGLLLSIVFLPALHALPIESNPLLALFVVILAIFLSLVGYYLFQYIHYRNVVFTNIQEVELNRTETSMFGNHWGYNIGFIVEVTIDDIQIDVTTKHVFRAAQIDLMGNCLDDYAGKVCEVGYDKKRNEWIVLCAES